MTLEEFKETDWYKERPEIIKQAICLLPPMQLYKFKESGYQCYIVSYEEPDPSDEMFKTVTVTVQKTGVGGPLAGTGFERLNTNGVFGVKLDDLEPW